jgi:hypothetical protein
MMSRYGVAPLLLGCLVGCCSRNPTPPPVPPAAPSTVRAEWLARAWRVEKEGWIVVHVEGEARARGFQHGALLAPEIADALHIERRVWEYKSGMTWEWLVAETAPFLLRHMDSENLAEIDGLVEGLSSAHVTTTREEMTTYNAYIELAGYWWPLKKKSLGLDSPERSRESCSSFIATGSMTADGGIVLGHNTMTGYVDGFVNVIIDIAPSSGHRILMQTCPGWIHSGSDFFITDAGLVGSETTIGGFSGYDEHGVPEFCRMRRATQDADSIGQWCDIITRGNNGGYANTWLLGNTRTGEIARLELGLKHVDLTRTHEGYYIGSNIPENLKILRFETDIKETDIRRSGVARRVRWGQLMEQYRGRITAALAKQFEADHYDTYLHRTTLDGRGLCDHSERDSLVDPPFDPGGSIDAKVVDSKMARAMTFSARWGAPCGTPFDAQEFLRNHPQFSWMAGLLKSRASYAWVDFTAGKQPS